MTGGEFQSLIKKDTYQVFLLVCPATLPFSFATHPWLVVNRKGVVSRHGVSWRKAAKSSKPLFGQHLCTECSEHVHKDARPPMEGIEIFPLVQKYLWKGRILKSIEGDDGSLAKRMADFIDESVTAYPYKDRYALLGPNSNTYIGWILEHFPESGMRLPWTAIGKGFRSRPVASFKS
jgi:hypothetical protein